MKRIKLESISMKYLFYEIFVHAHDKFVCVSRLIHIRLYKGNSSSLKDFLFLARECRLIDPSARSTNKISTSNFDFSPTFDFNVNFNVKFALRTSML